MTNEEDKDEYSKYEIANIIGYVKGLLDTLGLFVKREWHRQYCTIEMLELPIDDKDKIIQERVDGTASKLEPTEDYVAGNLERMLLGYFEDRCSETEASLRNENIEETWKYVIWRIAEYLTFIEKTELVKSCSTEKAIITHENSNKPGTVYCLTINSKFIILLKIHDVKIPKKEIDEYQKALKEYK